MDRVLPIISMSAICFIIGIITSRSRNQLMNVGLALIGAAIIHNFVGYVLGYWLARAAQLDKVTSRTVAIEVGMQNAGMASGLAMGVLQSAEAALAPAIFGPWMNISGALLATYWRRKPVGQKGSEDSFAKAETIQTAK
jgi:BASS family bile acid:Na+ symporter